MFISVVLLMFQIAYEQRSEGGIYGMPRVRRQSIGPCMQYNVRVPWLMGIHSEEMQTSTREQVHVLSLRLI